METTRAAGDFSCVCSTGGGRHRLLVVLPLILVASASPYAAAASSLTRTYVAPVATNEQPLPAANQSPVVRGSSVAATGVPPQESAAQVQQKAVSTRRRTRLDRILSSRRGISRSVFQSNAKALVLAVAAALVTAIVAVVVQIRCSRNYVEKGGVWGNGLRWRRLSEGHDDRDPLCSSYWDVGTEDGDAGRLAEGGHAGRTGARGGNGPARLQRLLLLLNGQQTSTSRGGHTGRGLLSYAASRLLVLATLALVIYIIYHSFTVPPRSAKNSTALPNLTSTSTASTGRTPLATFASVETTDAGQSTPYTTSVNTTGAADGLASELHTEKNTTDGEASKHPTSSNTTE